MSIRGKNYSESVLAALKALMVLMAYNISKVYLSLVASQYYRARLSGGCMKGSSSSHPTHI